jgi:hypothetical protein
VSHDLCVAVFYSRIMKESFKAVGANCWLRIKTPSAKSTFSWVGWNVVAQS